MTEWKDTLNLPRTDFPMKANLQTAEPQALARWAEMRLYDRLFSVPFPGARSASGDGPEDGEPAPRHAVAVAGEDADGGDDRERTFLDDLNPESKRVIAAFVEPSLAAAVPEARVQFERHGYFVADLIDHGAGQPVFNRTVTLRDSWTRKAP